MANKEDQKEQLEEMVEHLNRIKPGDNPKIIGSYLNSLYNFNCLVLVVGEGEKSAFLSRLTEQMSYYRGSGKGKDVTADTFKIAARGVEVMVQLANPDSPWEVPASGEYAVAQVTYPVSPAELRIYH